MIDWVIVAVTLLVLDVLTFVGTELILVGAAVVFAKLELLPGVIGAPEE